MRFSPTAQHRLTRAAGVTALGVLISGCSLTTGLGGVSSGAPAAGSVDQRQHQDAQVYAMVMRDDLTSLESLGTVCTDLASRSDCLVNARATPPLVARALADIKRLRVPGSMASDNTALVTALNRVNADCAPVINAVDRIAMAYADNEYDTAIEQLAAALSKVEQDGV